MPLPAAPRVQGGAAAYLQVAEAQAGALATVPPALVVHPVQDAEPVQPVAGEGAQSVQQPCEQVVRGGPGSQSRRLSAGPLPQISAWPGCRSPGTPGPRVPREPRPRLLLSSRSLLGPRQAGTWCGQNACLRPAVGDGSARPGSEPLPSPQCPRCLLDAQKSDEAWSPAAPWAAAFEVLGLSLPLHAAQLPGPALLWAWAQPGQPRPAAQPTGPRGCGRQRAPHVATVHRGGDRPRPPWCLLGSFPAAWGWLPALGVGSLGQGPLPAPSQTPAGAQMTLAESTAPWLQSRGARDSVIWEPQKGPPARPSPRGTLRPRHLGGTQTSRAGRAAPAGTYLQCWPLAGTRSTPWLRMRCRLPSGNPGDSWAPSRAGPGCSLLTTGTTLKRIFLQPPDTKRDRCSCSSSRLAALREPATARPRPPAATAQPWSLSAAPRDPQRHSPSVWTSLTRVYPPPRERAQWPQAPGAWKRRHCQSQSQLPVSTPVSHTRQQPPLAPPPLLQPRAGLTSSQGGGSWIPVPQLCWVSF